MNIEPVTGLNHMERKYNTMEITQAQIEAINNTTTTAEALNVSGRILSPNVHYGRIEYIKSLAGSRAVSGFFKPTRANVRHKFIEVWSEQADVKALRNKVAEREGVDADSELAWKFAYSVYDLELPHAFEDGEVFITNLDYDTALSNAHYLEAISSKTGAAA